MNGRELETFDPVSTLTKAAPGVASKEAGTRAESCELEIIVVASGVGVPVALHCTTEAEVKLLPVTVN